MVTQSEFEEAAREFHLAVNGAHHAQEQADLAYEQAEAVRGSLEDMQCLKEFQRPVEGFGIEDFEEVWFVVDLCGRQKGHSGPHDEGVMADDYGAAVILAAAEPS